MFNGNSGDLYIFSSRYFALKLPALLCKIMSEVMLVKLKAILNRMLSMCPEAWYIFRRSLQLSAFLMLCAFALLVEWGGCMIEKYTLYMTATALMEICQALLLIAVIASVCIEDHQS